MDSDHDVPQRLQERTRESIDESVALRKRWNGKGGGRLHAAFAPRFAVSCSRELLEAVADLSARERVVVHTHASENREEVEFVRRISGGMSNIGYLAETGLATPHLLVEPGVEEPLRVPLRHARFLRQCRLRRPRNAVIVRGIRNCEQH